MKAKSAGAEPGTKMASMILLTAQPTLHYKGELIGGYKADLVVDDKIILELKSVQALSAVMEAQTINYLRLSKIPVGYLVNFNGVRVQWRRLVYQRA